jgi:predicted DNA-binding transcriptional regulator AlpA
MEMTMSQIQTFQTADASADKPMGQFVALRANQIAGPNGILPIGLSTWWKGVKAGTYPPGTKISPGVTIWRRDQVMALLDQTQTS